MEVIYSECKHWDYDEIGDEREPHYGCSHPGNKGSTCLLEGEHGDCPLLDDHTVLLRGLHTPVSKNHMLYYYQGNFFYPLDVAGADRGMVKKAIREFKQTHSGLVAKDRAHPEYRNLLELMGDE